MSPKMLRPLPSQALPPSEEVVSINAVDYPFALMFPRAGVAVTHVDVPVLRSLSTIRQRALISVLRDAADSVAAMLTSDESAVES